MRRKRVAGRNPSRITTMPSAAPPDTPRVAGPDTCSHAGRLPDAPDSSCCRDHDAFGILHDCHEHILERLARLEGVACDLETAARLDESHLARLGDVLAFLHTAIPIHSADEEVSLFPRLRAVVGSTQGHTPMDCMEQEHVQHRDLLVRLERAIVRRDAAQAASAARLLVAEYRSHIGREEEVLFPWAREILAHADTVAQMTGEMRRRRVEAGLMSC